MRILSYDWFISNFIPPSCREIRGVFFLVTSKDYHMETGITLDEAKELIKKLTAENQILHSEIDEKSYYVGVLEEELQTREVGMWVAGVAFVVTFVILLMTIM
jgi:hypothetical protein